MNAYCAALSFLSKCCLILHHFQNKIRNRFCAVWIWAFLVMKGLTASKNSWVLALLHFVKYLLCSRPVRRPLCAVLSSFGLFSALQNHPIISGCTKGQKFEIKSIYSCSLRDSSWFHCYEQCALVVTSFESLHSELLKWVSSTINRVFSCVTVSVLDGSSLSFESVEEKSILIA